MGRTLNVLVLGVGGNVSQGILKALAVGSVPTRVIGAGVTAGDLGIYTSDVGLISPWVADPAFDEWLFDVCDRYAVDAVMSGNEPVLVRLAELSAKLREERGAVCIVSAADKMRLAIDKMGTCEWLVANGLDAPACVASDDAADVNALVGRFGFPLLAKPRHGKGSQGVIAVRGDHDLDYVRGLDDYVVQQALGDDEGEFTVGCLCDVDGKVRGTISMRRRLVAGTTSYAYVEPREDVEAYASRIAEAMAPLGPINVQLRLHEGRPVCFEINLRFSGTAPIRARLGFNDVDESLRHFVLGEPARDMPRVTSGIAVRYWNEAYIDPVACAAVEGEGRLEDPRAWPPVIEDYGISR